MVFAICYIHSLMNTSLVTASAQPSGTGQVKRRHVREICELALAHDERGETESAYSRSDFFDKRRELMNAWAIYATSTPEVADEAQRESSGE